MISLEEGVGERDGGELFALRGKEREAMGRCFAGMELAGVEEGEREGFATVLHTFRRSPAAEDENASSPPPPSLLDSSISLGDLLTISTEPSPCGSLPPRWGISRGKVTHLSAQGVTVALSTNLRDVGIGSPHAPRVRLDRCESACGFAQCRSNLLRLLAAPPPSPLQPPPLPSISPSPLQPSHHRRLIVDLAPPSFQAAEPLLSSLPSPSRDQIDQLNPEQRHALERILSARDYALVQGMPGTGKTTLIAHAASALSSLGGCVLLCAYTHAALDHTLLKLIHMGTPFLRLGAADRASELNAPPPKHDSSPPPKNPTHPPLLRPA